jgi:demethylspheroidene O-methyltransferase
MPDESVTESHRSSVSEGLLQSVFDDLDGFVLSQVLMTAIDIDLFPLLEDKELVSAFILDQLGLDKQNGKTFLNICYKFGYLTATGDTYSLSTRSKAVLRSYERFKGYVEQRKHMYKDMVSMSHLIRTGERGQESVGLWPYMKDDPNGGGLSVEAVTPYSQFMDSTNRFWTGLFLDAVDLSRFSALLDVGGGAGALATEVAKHYPSIKVGIFDLPAVVRIAEERIKASHLDAGVRCYPGDFFVDPLPALFDVMTLMRVAWDWQDREASLLLSKIYAALPDAGSVMVCERMYTGDQEVDRQLARMEVRLLLANGKMRSVEEHSAMLAATGFVDVRTAKTDFPGFQIVQGTKARR